MKRSFFLFACFIVTVTGSVLAQSADEKQLAAAVEKLKKAMIDANREQLQAITAEELSYGHSSGKIEDKAAFVEALASGKSDFISMELSNQTIKIAGNTALVRHNLTGSTVDNGVPASPKLGVLLVWIKQRGDWKLLARQAFKL